ncbi:MAG: hypothetical protein L6R40_004633 [Gallowayella cf. fulva]|nr:MAG: hypothetical protein L6R40_004633 [Xanthomendoza cf. fulva]
MQRLVSGCNCTALGGHDHCLGLGQIEREWVERDVSSDSEEVDVGPDSRYENPQNIEEEAELHDSMLPTTYHFLRVTGDLLVIITFDEDIAWYEGPNREWIAFDYVPGEVQCPGRRASIQPHNHSNRSAALKANVSSILLLVALSSGSGRLNPNARTFTPSSSSARLHRFRPKAPGALQLLSAPVMLSQPDDDDDDDEALQITRDTYQFKFGLPPLAPTSRLEPYAYQLSRFRRELAKSNLCSRAGFFRLALVWLFRLMAWPPHGFPKVSHCWLASGVAPEAQIRFADIDADGKDDYVVIGKAGSAADRRDNSLLEHGQRESHSTVPYMTKPTVWGPAISLRNFETSRNMINPYPPYHHVGVSLANQLLFQEIGIRQAASPHGATKVKVLGKWARRTDQHRPKRPRFQMLSRLRHVTGTMTSKGCSGGRPGLKLSSSRQRPSGQGPSSPDPVFLRLDDPAVYSRFVTLMQQKCPKGNAFKQVSFLDLADASVAFFTDRLIPAVVPGTTSTGRPYIISLADQVNLMDPATTPLNTSDPVVLISRIKPAGTVAGSANANPNQQNGDQPTTESRFSDERLADQYERLDSMLVGSRYFIQSPASCAAQLCSLEMFALVAELSTFESLWIKQHSRIYKLNGDTFCNDAGISSNTYQIIPEPKKPTEALFLTTKPNGYVEPLITINDEEEQYLNLLQNTHKRMAF